MFSVPRCANDGLIYLVRTVLLINGLHLVIGLPVQVSGSIPWDWLGYASNGAVLLRVAYSHEPRICAEPQFQSHTPELIAASPCL